MSTVRIQCPRCHNSADVVEHMLGRKARCHRCGEVFILRAADLEDTVVDWLAQPLGAVPPVAMALHAGTTAVATRTATTPAAAPSAPPATQKKPVAVPVPMQGSSGDTGYAAPPPIVLDHVDELGAFFVFPTSLLENETFRRSMPRCCLRCGSTVDLSLHVVVWSSMLPDRDRLRLKSGLEKVALVREHVDLSQISALYGTLPRVPHLPFPFDLPIPYFMCNKCTPSGALMTHVRDRADGGHDCEIGIASLKRASEFLAANIGRDGEDYRRLLQAARDRHSDPWTALPLAVRNRIEVWFKRENDEHFVAYIHDNDFSRAEAGCGGIVVTSRRMLYHKFAANREFSLREPLELTAKKKDEKYLLQITAASLAGNKPVLLRCDPSATDVIRTALKQAGTPYTYRA